MNTSAATSGVLGLIAECHLEWKRYLQRRLSNHDITLKQFHVLNRLDRHDALHPMDLAESLYCDRPTVSTILRNMKKRGWVDRGIDPKDARYILVSITPAGRKTLRAIRDGGVFAGADFANPLEVFSSRELHALKESLSKLHTTLVDVTRP